MMYNQLKSVLVVVLLYLSFAVPAKAAPAGIYDVFFGVENRTARLYFVDARTGLTTSLSANGTRHTLTAVGVLYVDASGAIHLARPDSKSISLPAFPQITTSRSVDWVVSSDLRVLAWSVTEQREGQVYSDVYTLNLTNTSTAQKLVLHTSSTQGIGILPLAISTDGNTLVYARRDDLFTERPTSLPIGAGFRLNVPSGDTQPLPDGAGCPCITAFSVESRSFARLEVSGQRGSPTGYNAHVWNWTTNSEQTVNALPPAQSTIRGSALMVLSQDGRLGAYVAARDTTTLRPYTVMLVDLQVGKQRILLANLRDSLRPVGFSTDGTALMLLGVDKSGTYKIPLSGGSIVQVSTYSWLGVLLI